MRRPGGVLGGRGKSDPGAPTQPVVVARHRLDHDVTLDAGQPLQLLRHHLTEQAALARERDVLEVAAAAGTRPGMRARRINSVRRRVDDLDTSPRKKRERSSPSVMDTTARSPGTACRTKITRPSCRATQ